MRVIPAPREQVFAFLADLENHWLITDRFVRVLSLEGPAGARQGGDGPDPRALRPQPHRLDQGRGLSPSGRADRLGRRRRRDQGRGPLVALREGGRDAGRADRAPDRRLAARPAPLGRRRKALDAAAPAAGARRARRPLPLSRTQLSARPQSACQLRSAAAAASTGPPSRTSAPIRSAAGAVAPAPERAMRTSPARPRRSSPEPAMSSSVWA